MHFKPAILRLGNYPKEQFKNSSNFCLFHGLYVWKVEAIYMFNHRRIFKYAHLKWKKTAIKSHVI